MRLRSLLAFLVGLIFSVFVTQTVTEVHAMSTLTPTEARAIAKEAYIYGFPLVDNYRIMHSYFVDSDGSEFKAPWNQIHNEARVYTPQQTKRFRPPIPIPPTLNSALTCAPSPWC